MYLFVQISIFIGSLHTHIPKPIIISCVAAYVYKLLLLLYMYVC